MENFATMVTKVFGVNSEIVTRYFGNQFDEVIFYTEEAFLKKISSKLKKPLRDLDKISVGIFWFNRLMELDVKTDADYVLYVIRLLTPLSKYLEKDRRYFKKYQKLELLATARIVEVKGINFNEEDEYENIQKQVTKLLELGY